MAFGKIDSIVCKIFYYFCISFGLLIEFDALFLVHTFSEREVLFLFGLVFILMGLLFDNLSENAKLKRQLKSFGWKDGLE